MNEGATEIIQDGEDKDSKKREIKQKKRIHKKGKEHKTGYWDFNQSVSNQARRKEKEKKLCRSNTKNFLNSMKIMNPKIPGKKLHGPQAQEP